MNKRKKGNITEREVEKFLQSLGYTTHRARQSYFLKGNQTFSISNDIFQCFDIIAKKNNSSTLWIQVTTGYRIKEKELKIKKLNIWNERDKIFLFERLKNKNYRISEFKKNKFKILKIGKITEIKNILKEKE